VERPLAGHFSVEHSARVVTHYRYAVERLMRILGGWIALTPEISAKLLLGRHVWDNAQHADLFGRRLLELRERAQTSTPASPALVAVMDEMEHPDGPDQTVERLAGVYRVFKPHLLALYQEHLGRANLVYEPPTRRILERCAEDEHRHIAAAEVILRHLASTPAARERAAAWEGVLRRLVAEAGGATGEGVPDADAAARAARADGSAEAEEFIRLEALGDRWTMPEGLGPALAAVGPALARGEPQGLRDWLDDPSAWTAETESALRTAGFTGSRVVAVARIGSERAVKLRLEGPSAAATVLTRWRSTERGWRLRALELLRVDAVPAA
jgi:hypothetical protein